MNFFSFVNTIFWRALIIKTDH